MSRQKFASQKKVAAYRARQIAAGRQLVNTYLPAELIELIDQTKEVKGVRGRTPIIEEALRFYFEKQQGHNGKTP
jgi:metal-responsive CopG/Arc/MetJ family transcriptional regulator